VDHAILRHHWTNMDEVAPGVWRSNQPTHRRFAELKARGIHTIFNLRGHGEESFHLFARESCAALGLRQVSVALRSRRAPERAEVLKLFEAFRTSEKPFLIHCKSGADRSGFASALYLLAHEGATVAEARRHLSFRYLHLRRGRAGVLGHILDLYEARLARGPIGVEEWFRAEYDADAAQAGFRR
jgi:protein tyrosine/serine phosphatase